MAEAATGTGVATSSAPRAKTETPASVTGRPDAPRVLVALALVLSALAYLNTLRFQFVYDDLPQIVNNFRVHSLRHAPRLFVEHVWSQFSGQPGNYYRPLFELWLAINYKLFGLNAGWWHATAVVAHLVVVAMVYVLARRIMADRLTAAMATVIFALHPTHIESVAWVSGIPDVLLAVFVIGSMLSYARSRDTKRESGTSSMLLRLVSVVSYGLGMLCKETGVMLPLLLFAYDRLIFARHSEEKDGLAAIARRYAPYAIVAVVYMAVRHHVLGDFGYPEAKPWGDVILTLPSFLWFYVRELVWPVGLSVFHDTPLVHTPGMANFALPLLGVVAAFVAAVYASRRAREAAFGTWWLALLMVPPIIGIYAFIPEDLVHDRYLYLPSVGFAMAVAWAIRQLKSKQALFGAPLAPMGMTLVVAVLLALGVARQNVYWQNDLVLYVHAVKAAPRNVIAINHLANEFYKRRRPADALALYAESLKIKPQNWATHFALGITQYELGNFAETQKHLETAIPLLPRNSDEYYYLALAHLQQGHYAEAETNFRKTIAMYASKPGAHYGLAITLEKQGQWQAARQELETEWKINPSSEVKREIEKLDSSPQRDQ